MAFDLMFSKTERVFSDTKIYVSPTHSCLGSDISEATESYTLDKGRALIGWVEAAARPTRMVIKVRRIRLMILISQIDTTSQCNRKTSKNSSVQEAWNGAGYS
jgi:hypothetical protein